MKISIAFFFLTASAFAQGTMYFYDQQSSTNETPFPGTGGAMQQIAAPWGQSFTPSLASIDFIRLKFSDGNPLDGTGATIYLNLHSDSLSGALVGTTAPVTMPNNFAGTTTFVFPSSIPLIPGIAYYFEPILVGSSNWKIDASEYGYPGGSVFANGLPQLGSDLWFREGLIVPEPSMAGLLLLAGGTLFCFRRGKQS